MQMIIKTHLLLPHLGVKTGKAVSLFLQWCNLLLEKITLHILYRKKCIHLLLCRMGNAIYASVLVMPSSIFQRANGKKTFESVRFLHLRFLEKSLPSKLLEYVLCF